MSNSANEGLQGVSSETCLEYNDSQHVEWELTLTCQRWSLSRITQCHMVGCFGAETEVLQPRAFRLLCISIVKQTQNFEFICCKVHQIAQILFLR
jgi:hypothetical protein